MLIEADDRIFAALAAGETPPGLVGGVAIEPPDIIRMLRTEAIFTRRDFEPAGWLIVEAGWAVGLLTLRSAPDVLGQVEIGYAVAAAWRRRGVASRALNAFVAWARAEPCLTAILAETGVDNLTSQRVLARAGFVRGDERVDAHDGGLIGWRLVLRHA